MNVIEALETRRTIREYDSEYKIPQDVLGKIVDVALDAPTGCNNQPIDLLVVTNRDTIDRATKITFDSWPEEKRNNWNKRKEQYGVKNVVSCDASCIIFLVSNERADQDFVQIDAGIISMAIMTAARNFDLHTMCLGALLWGNKAGLEECLGIPQGKMVMAVAVGKAKPNFQLKDKERICKATYIE